MQASDVLVIGAGAFGLWTALACLERGMSVTVIDERAPGAGASGGPVGALAPHAPERWSAKADFQLRALVSLPERIAALEARTGLATGYRRIGRAVPLADAAQRAQAEARIAAAARRWPGARMWIEERAPEAWPLAAPWGLQRDDLTARIDPAALCAALSVAVAQEGGRILPGLRARRVGPGWAQIGARRVRARAVVVAAGWRSFALLAPWLPGAGEPEHGQAALLAMRPPPEAFAIQARGLWIVPHARGVAVGSTATRRRADRRTDAALEAVIGRARALCPALEGAPVIRRWAAARPRAASRAPLVGPVPGAQGLFAATGGFKIGVAIAHAAAEALGAMIARQPHAMPDEFLPRNLPRAAAPWRRAERSEAPGA
ncbi:NAD(P)/FAD-dependent oxidoreductase [Oceanicella actignis]|uniref:Glycine/D-amino acid oxidase n=1 Tax=Oceanicella actignis TaxID=1189325 RepID=A0A1M7T422_9RHOB|nr:FAD-dependent oxidoreductase [Oceanicella actignis]SET40927.1 Glycine/D-amino acid oxidase [Oceanicella actignis]SHN65446.1 Glycine/D-amino acid oxidase [Oceanicella actignis]